MTDTNRKYFEISWSDQKNSLLACFWPHFAQKKTPPSSDGWLRIQLESYVISNIYRWESELSLVNQQACYSSEWR